MRSLWAMVLLVAACNSPQALPDGQDEAKGEAEAVECEGGTALVGAYFRFDRFDVKQPRGPEDGLASTLTNLWAAQIAAKDLNILLHVTRLDEKTGEMDVEAGTARYITTGPSAGNYQMTADPPPKVLSVRLEGCRFASTTPGALSVFPDLLTVPISILDTRIGGTFDAGLIRVEQGHMVGGICHSMAKDQYFKLYKDMEGCINFLAFMEDLGVMPDRNDLPCGGDDPTGYTFEGEFVATRITNVLEPPKVFQRDFSCN